MGWNHTHRVKASGPADSSGCRQLSFFGLEMSSRNRDPGTATKGQDSCENIFMPLNESSEGPPKQQIHRLAAVKKNAQKEKDWGLVGPRNARA